jgi:LPXTG-motif cell wall-anchored protein
MICELSDNPPASCSSTDEPKTDKPKTGLFVVLVVAGIVAIGLVAFLLKRRNNRKLQVSPQLGTESAAVVSAIPIKDGRTKAPAKVREEPSSKVKETFFEDVDLSDEHV